MGANCAHFLSEFKKLDLKNKKHQFSNGIIGKAGNAQNKWNEAHQKELNQMDDIEKTIAGYTVETTQTEPTKN